MPHCGCCHIKISSFSLVFHAQSDSRVVTRQKIPAIFFSLCYSALMSALTYSLSSWEAYQPACLLLYFRFLVLYYYSTFLWHLDLRGMCGHKTKYITEACHIITQRYPVLLHPQISYLIVFPVQMHDWSTYYLYSRVGIFEDRQNTINVAFRANKGQYGINLSLCSPRNPWRNSLGAGSFAAKWDYQHS